MRSACKSISQTLPISIATSFWDEAEDEPLTAEARAVLSKRQNQQPPQVRCLPEGVPGVMMVYAFKIVQTPLELMMMGESQEPPRQIYLDGRGFPKDPDPSWMGYSIGRWDNDTLVVQTTGFKEEGWLDNVGHPRGESMLITERFRRRDFGHIDLEIHYEDPKYYTRPFTNKATLTLIPIQTSLNSFAPRTKRRGTFGQAMRNPLRGKPRLTTHAAEWPAMAR